MYHHTLHGSGHPVQIVRPLREQGHAKERAGCLYHHPACSRVRHVGKIVTRKEGHSSRFSCAWRNCCCQGRHAQRQSHSSHQPPRTRIEVQESHLSCQHHELFMQCKWRCQECHAQVARMTLPSCQGLQIGKPVINSETTPRSPLAHVSRQPIGQRDSLSSTRYAACN